MAGRQIHVRGTVQGVGFRPWVYRLAERLGLHGRVRNSAEGVTIEAFGPDAELEEFIRRLQADAPSSARVANLRSSPIPDEAGEGFVIESSEISGSRALSIPPDLATCPQCQAEVDDPGDRRYRYAFTNCTGCGPRFTIATGIPYDRAATTMASFAMCSTCRAEYDDVQNRRFHAQPNACPSCGPALRLVRLEGGQAPASDALTAAAELLKDGAVVA
ncbi:MAG: acylphosphatase, partial [Polyangiales bacterium]